MKLTERKIEKVMESIEEADKVIVGFGEEWEVCSIPSTLDAKEQQRVSLELQKSYDVGTEKSEKILENKKENQTEKQNWLTKGYQALKHVLAKKDYFLLTTNADAFLYWQGFEEERIVSPCGDIRRLQCEVAEHGVWNLKPGEPVSVCPICGRQGRLNMLQNTPYCERGYLKDWETYQKWLQGVIHRKTVILELGEGFRAPTVMRWPFEKLVFFQEKAVLFRVHKRLGMISEEISKRAYSIEENSVEFAIQLEKQQTKGGQR